MPRGDSVHGVGVIRDLGDPTRQLLPKSYRARSAAQNRFRQLRDPRGKLLRGAEQRTPELLAACRVEPRGYLPPAHVEDRETAAGAGGYGEPARERVEGADAAHGQAPAEPQRPRRGDADPQAGEGTGADPDRDPPDRLPAAGSLRRQLDLTQQRSAVLRPPLLGEAEKGLVENLAAARRGNRGVAGRSVEPDDGQRLGTKKLKSPTRLPLTNQVTRCLPGMLELILLT